MDNNFDDLMPVVKGNNAVAAVPSVSKPKQESVRVFENVPPGVMKKIKPVEFPPSKQTRFTFDESIQKDLTAAILAVFPGASVDFKPNKAEVADMTIWRDDSMSERIGCVNFIHQDRPKNGSPQNNKKYVEVMFFNFEDTDEYDKIKPVIVDFFKDIHVEGNTDMSTESVEEHNNQVEEYNQSNTYNPNTLTGGKRSKKAKKTQKKKKTARRSKKQARTQKRQHRRK